MSEKSRWETGHEKINEVYAGDIVVPPEDASLLYTYDILLGLLLLPNRMIRASHRL